MSHKSMCSFNEVRMLGIKRTRPRVAFIRLLKCRLNIPSEKNCTADERCAITVTEREQGIREKELRGKKRKWRDNKGKSGINLLQFLRGPNETKRHNEGL